jgi:hypothetical protein
MTNGSGCLPGSAVTGSFRERISTVACRRREANKYNIHTDRHLIGLPRLNDEGLAEAPFAVYQTDQEGETRLFRHRSLPRPARSRRAAPQIPRQADPARHLCHPEPARHTAVDRQLDPGRLDAKSRTGSASSV